jgi:hypothetical protein
MSVPMRKDDFLKDDLTTADLAQGKRPAESVTENRITQNRAAEDRPGPVLAERAQTNAVEGDSLDARKEIEENERQETPRKNGASTTTADAADTTPLFPPNELEDLRNRWSGVQTAFVDEPRRAVEQADGLVASAMKRLAEVFAEERSKLEQQWDRGDNVSTEDLRIALQRYRSFFHRLLAI